jgi:uncharacterized protein (UPF0210 family)
MDKDIIVLIDELKEKIIKLEQENVRLRKLTLTRGFHIKKEVSKDIIQEIKKVKPPVTNSAATFAFELEKTLEQIEKKYGI